MTAATAAADLGADHSEAAILVHLDVLRNRRLVEARPTRPGLELRVRAEELGPTSGAAICPVILERDVLAREWTLGPLASENLVLLGRQSLTPLLI
jgi:hypothetical protein